MIPVSPRKILEADGVLLYRTDELIISGFMTVQKGEATAVYSPKINSLKDVRVQPVVWKIRFWLGNFIISILISQHN